MIMISTVAMVPIAVIKFTAAGTRAGAGARPLQLALVAAHMYSCSCARVKPHAA